MTDAIEKAVGIALTVLGFVVIVSLVALPPATLALVVRELLR